MLTISNICHLTAINNRKFAAQSPWKDLTLLHSEVTEMSDTLREQDKGVLPRVDDHCPNFNNEVIEGADIIIRTLGYLLKRGYTEQNIAGAITAKLQFNYSRQDHVKEATAADLIESLGGVGGL